MAESEEVLKSLLIKMKEKSEKADLKQHSKSKDHGIRSHHFMANRWGNSGNHVRVYFLGAPKSLQMVTVAMKLKDTCSLEVRLWQTLKNTDYFANKGLSSQSYGFSSSHVWMWELGHKESWALKNWCFWNVVLEKTLESSLDCRRSNQSLLKDINPEYSSEGLILQLKPQYFGQLMQRADSLEKTLVLGKIEGKRRREWQRVR